MKKRLDFGNNNALFQNDTLSHTTLQGGKFMTPFLQEGGLSLSSLDYESSSEPAGSTFIYRSKAIDSIMQVVRKAAPLKTAVLITGDKGSGKSCLARYIHSQSKVKFGHFETLHCGSLSQRVLESELFGFRGDKFTPSYEGALRAADGGTLLLRDITKMPLYIQEKFYRFLSTGKVTPVGSKCSYPVNVRIIYSTSEEEEITGHHFSRKLYAKINPIRIKIPNLSQRREDIPDLVRYFLSLDLAQAGKKRKKYTIREKAMDALKCYKWPGNVRELKNVCEHFQVFANNEITVKELPKQILDAEESSVKVSYDPTLTLSDINRVYILSALRHFPSKKRAAKALGITVKTLYNRLHEYGIFDKYAIHSPPE